MDVHKVFFDPAKVTDCNRVVRNLKGAEKAEGDAIIDNLDLNNLKALLKAAVQLARVNSDPQWASAAVIEDEPVRQVTPAREHLDMAQAPHRNGSASPFNRVIHSTPSIRGFRDEANGEGRRLDAARSPSLENDDRASIEDAQDLGVSEGENSTPSIGGHKKVKRAMSRRDHINQAVWDYNHRRSTPPFNEEPEGKRFRRF